MKVSEIMIRTNLLQEPHPSSHVETLTSLKRFKNALNNESIKKRSCINHMSFDSSSMTLAVSSSCGLTLIDGSTLTTKLNILSKIVPGVQNSSQPFWSIQSSLNDTEVNQSVFIPKTPFIVYACSDGTVNVHNIKDNELMASKKFKEPCLSLCLIPSQNANQWP